MNCTMKAEIKVVPPPPPTAKVVITMSPEEAVMLRGDLRNAIDTSAVQLYGLNRLWNELSNLNLT